MRHNRAMLLSALLVALAVGQACLADAAADAARFVESLRRDTKDPSKLPAKILAAARSLDENAKLRTALYEKVFELGARTPGGHTAAIEALDALLKAVPEKAAKWREGLLKVHQLRLAAAPAAEKRKIAQRMVELLIALGDEHLAAGRGTKAGEVYKRAAALAQMAGSGEKALIAEKLKLARLVRGIEQQIRTHRDRLQRDPKDERSRRELIRLYVVELDRPGEAQQLLSDTVAETWRTYVPLAVRAVADLAEAACGEMGDWYWQHAQRATAVGKPRMLDRAGDYYERFLELHKPKDAAYLTAKSRFDQLAKTRRLRANKRFGMVKWEVTAVHPVGHACQVWRILPKYALGSRYRVSIRHAVAGAAGAFYIIAFADSSGNGRPDTRIGISPLCRAAAVGQWSSWEFRTKHKTVFVGNCWRNPPRLYYHSARHPVGYVGLSTEMYMARSPGKMPVTNVAGGRYTNIRVEVIE